MVSLLAFLPYIFSLKGSIVSVFSDIKAEEFAKKHGLNEEQTTTLLGLWAGQLSIHSTREFAPDEVWEREKWLENKISKADELSLKAFTDMLETLVRKLKSS